MQKEYSLHGWHEKNSIEKQRVRVESITHMMYCILTHMQCRMGHPCNINTSENILYRDIQAKKAHSIIALLKKYPDIDELFDPSLLIAFRFIFKEVRGGESKEWRLPNLYKIKLVETASYKVVKRIFILFVATAKVLKQSYGVREAAKEHYSPVEARWKDNRMGLIERTVIEHLFSFCFAPRYLVEETVFGRTYLLKPMKSYLVAQHITACWSGTRVLLINMHVLVF
ncbi:hypothetical protein ACJX0J_005319, partial [Zea mays]